MKQYHSNTKRSGRISFVLVMMLCTAMIGASCWFAYTQTAKDINMEISSIIDQSSRIPAAVPETGVAKAEKPSGFFGQQPRETEPAPTETIPVTEPTEPAERIPEMTEPPTAPPVVVTFRPPCSGEVVQEFSAGELVKSATTGIWQTHNGVDLAGFAGDPVFPMEAGIVTAVEEDTLWGICVTIDHQNGITSKYCGLHPGLKVTEGDAVTIDEPIGVIGETAEIESALPTHLHFEVRQAETLIDPVTYIYQHP